MNKQAKKVLLSAILASSVYFSSGCKTTYNSEGYNKKELPNQVNDEFIKRKENIKISLITQEKLNKSALRCHIYDEIDVFDTRGRERVYLNELEYISHSKITEKIVNNHAYNSFLYEFELDTKKLPEHTKKIRVDWKKIRYSTLLEKTTTGVLGETLEFFIGSDFNFKKSIVFDNIDSRRYHIEQNEKP